MKIKNIFDDTYVVQGITSTKESYDIQKMCHHGKPNVYSSHLHFGYSTESDESHEGDAKSFE